MEIVAKRLKRIMHEDGGGEQYIMQEVLDEGWIQLKVKKLSCDRIWSPRRKYENLEDLDVPKEIMVHHANWTEGIKGKVFQLNYVKKKVLPYEAFQSIGSVKEKQSKIAICLSSLLRNFEKSSESIIKSIINTLPSKPDLFGHFPSQCQTEDNLKYLKLIEAKCNQCFITFEDDEVDEKYLSYNQNLNAFQRNGIKGNLLQWTSMQKCCEMKIEVEKEYGDKYEWVIWSRPDLHFFNSLDNINNLDNSKFCVPAHDNHFCGIFDRFGMGNSEIMDKRMFMYEYFTEKWYPENAEKEVEIIHQ